MNTLHVDEKKCIPSNVLSINLRNYKINNPNKPQKVEGRSKKEAEIDEMANK